jgi:hypothetical protein
MLVRGALHRIRGKGALTAAAKRVGNAALGVKRALAVEAARRERIALREAGLLPPRKRTRGERPRPPSRAMAA